jgi:hypothetical protein
MEKQGYVQNQTLCDTNPRQHKSYVDESFYDNTESGDEYEDDMGEDTEDEDTEDEDTEDEDCEDQIYNIEDTTEFKMAWKIASYNTARMRSIREGGDLHEQLNRCGKNQDHKMNPEQNNSNAKKFTQLLRRTPDPWEHYTASNSSEENEGGIYKTREDEHTKDQQGNTHFGKQCTATSNLEDENKKGGGCEYKELDEEDDEVKYYWLHQVDDYVEQNPTWRGKENYLLSRHPDNLKEFLEKQQERGIFKPRNLSHEEWVKIELRKGWDPIHEMQLWEQQQQIKLGQHQRQQKQEVWKQPKQQQETQQHQRVQQQPFSVLAAQFCGGKEQQQHQVWQQQQMQWQQQWLQLQPGYQEQRYQHHASDIPGVQEEIEDSSPSDKVTIKKSQSGDINSSCKPKATLEVNDRTDEASKTNISCSKFEEDSSQGLMSDSEDARIINKSKNNTATSGILPEITTPSTKIKNNPRLTKIHQDDKFTTGGTLKTSMMKNKPRLNLSNKGEKFPADGETLKTSNRDLKVNKPSENNDPIPAT